jgi:hypothetical protein
MPYVPLFSVIIIYDPYYHEIVFPISAGYGKFSFVFDEPNIFVINAFKDWWRK